MSRRCEICNKGLQFGHNVSHSNRKTKRVWRPNIQKVRVIRNGRAIRMRVCTRCIRSGLIQKPT
jgi:large subunit ribosomal protein L28